MKASVRMRRPTTPSLPLPPPPTSWSSSRSPTRCWSDWRRSSSGVLIQAVESRGGDTTECLLLPRGDLHLGRRSVAPHVLCCRIWRWPDLQADYLLKRMPCCTAAGDPSSVCCNPYHWSRLNLPGMFPLYTLVTCPSVVVSPASNDAGGRCVLFAFYAITPIACVHTSSPLHLSSRSCPTPGSGGEQTNWLGRGLVHAR